MRSGPTWSVNDGEEGLRPDTLIPIAYTRLAYHCRSSASGIDDPEADLECPQRLLDSFRS